MAAGAAGAQGRWWGQVVTEPSDCSSNAAVAEGIRSIATVHDIFAARSAERFRRIIREQFAQMYAKNDALAQVLEYARNDLKDPKGLAAEPPGCAGAACRAARKTQGWRFGISTARRGRAHPRAIFSHVRVL